MIKVMSDLHHDYTEYQHKFLPEDKNYGLILAGDIFHSFSIMNQMRMQEFCKYFKWVVYVLGNHDYENTTITNRINQWKSLKEKCSNLFVLENESVILDNTRIIGFTLWTNYFNRSRAYMEIAKNCMPEFKSVFQEAGKIVTPQYLYDIHASSVNYLTIELSNKVPEKTIVVSHHMPLKNSVHEMYENDILNCAFYSDLSKIFDNYDFDYWIHGHTHTSADYVYNNKRVICNPRGYGKISQNKEFNDGLFINV